MEGFEEKRKELNIIVKKRRLKDENDIGRRVEIGKEEVIGGEFKVEEVEGRKILEKLLKCLGMRRRLEGKRDMRIVGKIN